MRNHLATNIFKLRELLKKNIEFNIIAEKLKKCSEALVAPLNIMIMGKFSTGKSTFINAMLGRDVANTDAVPTTAVITKFAYGKSDKIIAHFKDGKEKFFSIADFNALTSEIKGKRANLRKKITYVERQLNIDILKKYTFWDSPGLDANVKGHEEITQNFINNVDGILWLFSIDQAGSKIEMEALSKLSSHQKPIALVNKIDMADDDDEVEEILDDLRLKFRDKVLEIEGISAALAQEGRKRGDDNFIAESNIEIAYSLLDKHFYSDADYIKVNEFLKDINPIISEFTFIIKKYNNDNFNYRKALETEHDSYIESACTSYMQDMVKYRNLLEYNEKIRDTINRINLNIKNIISKIEMPSSNKAYGLLTRLGNGIWDEFYKMVGGTFCSACHGEAKSQYELGERLQRDWNKAVYWYQLAGNQEYLPAIKVLYSNLAHPQYWFEKAADMKDKYAILQCGLNYYTGNENFDKNNERAAYWLKRAVKLNSMKDVDVAQYYLGCIYENGIVVNKNYKEAYKMFSLAAKSHNKEAINKVAEYLYYGRGTKQDKLSAFVKWRDRGKYDLIKKYFVEDNFDLHRTIAIKYCKEDTDADYHKKILISDCENRDYYIDYHSKIWWLKLDFKHNKNTKSAYDCGNCYAKMDIDYKAVYWYQLAEEYLDLPELQLLYSILPNPQCWFEKAANIGDEYAILQCGLNYYTGNKNFNKNNEKAVYWLEKAVKQSIDNTATAQYYLGCMYEKGIVVNQDYEEAYKLFSVAASKDNRSAISKVAECLYYGRGIQQGKIAAFVKWRDGKMYDLVEKYFVEDNFNLHRTIALNYCKKYSADNYYKKIWWLELDFKHNKNTISAYDCGKYYVEIGNKNTAIYWYQLAGEHLDLSALRLLYSSVTNPQYWFEKAANLGDEYAILQCGLNYYTGNEKFVKNNERAVYWLKRAVKLNSMKDVDVAQYYLGYMYENGIVVSKDYNEAYKMFSLAAKSNNKEAINKVAEYLYNGRGTKQDKLSAFVKWRDIEKYDLIKKYFVEDNFNLHHIIAIKYCNKDDAVEYWKKINFFNSHDRDVVIDYNSKIWWLELDFKHNENTKSAYECGNFYTKIDIKDKAIFWYQLAGEHLDLPELQLLYSSLPNSQVWLEKAANLGDEYAILQCGLNYYTGNENFDKNNEKAVYWLEKAIKQSIENTDTAQYYLGCMYEKGIVVNQDYKEAYKLFSVAASKHNRSAISKVAECLYYGRGIEQDKLAAFVKWRDNNMYDLVEKYFVKDNYNLHHTIALNYCKDVSDDIYYSKIWWLELDFKHNQNAKSAYYSGKYYAEIGDYNKAAYYYQFSDDNLDLSAIKILYSNLDNPQVWIEKAANLGDEYAILQCGLGYYTGDNNFEKNGEKAAFWLMKAVEQNIDGTDIAQYYLGCMYESGGTVSQNYDKAYKLFSAAALKHNKKAISKVAECLYYGTGVQQDKLAAFVKWRNNGNYDLVDQYFVYSNYDLQYTIAMEYTDDSIISGKYYNKKWWLELDYEHNKESINAYDYAMSCIKEKDYQSLKEYVGVAAPHIAKKGYQSVTEYGKKKLGGFLKKSLWRENKDE